jgi:hypothetical protein
MTPIGKGIGTCGLWLGICAVISTLAQVEMLDPFGVALIMLGGFITTSYMWIDDKMIAAIEKTFEDQERRKGHL